MRELTIQTFIYYLIYSGASKGFGKIMQCKAIDLSCSIISKNDHNVPDKSFT